MAALGDIVMRHPHVRAGLDGALIPWLVGLTSARFGDLRLELLIPLFCVASMIVLQIVIYPGTGSGAFAESPMSIVIVNRLLACKTAPITGGSGSRK